jgi:alkanesulfonate monooxygenase SsuD/methylene tetrahydromethanopterin reductase-like flavin-dependent oxidoreductase (luciferase family)
MRMRLHVVLPNESVEVGPERILGLAQRAEELGLEGVWPPDHLLPPVDDGEIYGGVSEPLVTLASIAAATTRIRLGTSVLLQTGVFAPRPSGGPQVMVGGTSDAALRRAARWADVWQSPPMAPEAFAERSPACMPARNAGSRWGPHRLVGSAQEGP